MADPDLSVIIVSWNVRDLLSRCLRTLFAGGESDSLRLDVIVIDNDSQDDTATHTSTQFPQVRLLVNEDNPGFATANNQGLALARGRYCLLLNPDTEIVDDALGRMVAYMDSHPQVGVLGPQLRYPDGRLQPSRRRFPTLATALLESTPLQQLLPDNRVLRHYYVEDQPADVTQEVDWLVGASLLVRRQVVEAVGGLDEGYFMYFEELDWCRRIREAGWKVVYFPEAVVKHHEGQSSSQVVPLRHIRFQSSKVRYFTKVHGRASGEFLRWFLLAVYVWQSAVEGLKWLLGHKRTLRAARLHAYLQVLRSGLH
ncbi:MAG: glycosyltransferase family 2 protein [Chloroflexi bacterium]|nr:glycosyltransferase family 2 protein [Chloroflexota bacterium]